MYDSISPNLNFVEQEKKTKFLKKVSTRAQKASLMFFMTVRLPQTASRI